MTCNPFGLEAPTRRWGWRPATWALTAGASSSMKVRHTLGNVSIMSDEAIAILTTEGKERIIRHGGTQGWVIDRMVARRKPYVVCVRRAKHADAGSLEPDGTAFLVGRISGIVPLAESERREGDSVDRWKVVIREYAEVEVPDAWTGSRNPVRYTTLGMLGIDPAALDFRPVPSAPAEPASSAGPDRLTIQEAKEALARTFGVSPENIEITIRA